MSNREGIRRRTAEQLLVLRCQLRDERAFERLFQRYHDPVLYYLRRLSGDPAAAEDLFQAVWLQVYRKIATLRDPGAFRTWLFRIAHNKAVQRIRSLRQETSLEEADSTAVPEEDPPESAPMDPSQVHAALDRLSPAHREALTLRFLGEMSYEEIAGVTGCSLGTVRSRIHYAKRALRHALEAMNHD